MDTFSTNTDWRALVFKFFCLVSKGEKLAIAMLTDIGPRSVTSLLSSQPRFHTGDVTARVASVIKKEMNVDARQNLIGCNRKEAKAISVGIFQN